MDSKPYEDEVAAEVARTVESLVTVASHLGAICKIERQVGESKSFFHHRMAAGDLRVSQLARIVQAVGARVRLPLGNSAQMPKREDLLALSSRKRRPTAIEQAAEAALCRDAPGYSPADLVAQLDRVNDLRWESPVEALEVVRSCLETAAPHQVPDLLGAAAACFRLLHRFADAARCIARGHECALAGGNRLAQGNLLQKSVYLYNSMGAPEVALEFARDELLLFTRLGNPRKIGEALIDLGFCWYQLKNFEESLLANQDAGAYASEMTLKNRATRLQGVSRALHQLGRSEEALEHIRLAIAAAQGCPNPCFKASLLWAEGLALGSAGVPQLQQAVQLQTDRMPIDAALAAIELARAHLNAGQTHEAYRVAREMTVFVQPFHRVLAAAKALRHLILIGKSGHGLTLQTLAAAERAIEESRACYYRRFRRRR